MRNVNVNQVVGYRARGRRVDVVVAAVQYVKRGRHAGEKKYTLAPLKRDGKAYGFSCVGEVFFTEPSRTYTPAEINAAVVGYQGTAQHSAEVREQVVEKRQEKLEEKRQEVGDVRPGDEVRVKYSDIGLRWETVAEVNERTGKIGIVRRGAKEANERTARSAEAVTSQFLFGLKPKTHREVRWLHPSLVVEVRRPAAAGVL